MYPCRALFDYHVYTEIFLKCVNLKIGEIQGMYTLLNKHN